MPVKILIERKVKKDCLGKVIDLSTDLRAIAVQQPGYISGETLLSTEEDDLHLVICSWRNLNDWKAWENSPARLAIENVIEEYLERPVIAKAFVDIYGSNG